MRRQRLVAARDRDAALAAARQAEAQIAVAGGNSRQSTAEARARILADLAKAESEARLRKEELTKAVKRSSLQRLEIGRHTSELQSLMRISYAVFCLKKKNTQSQRAN